MSEAITMTPDMPEAPTATEPAPSSTWKPVDRWSADAVSDRTELAGFHYGGGLALLGFRHADPPNVRQAYENLLAAIRKETSRRAGQDESIKRFFQIEAESAALAATRQDALERLNAIEERKQRLLQPHHHHSAPTVTLDALQGGLVKLSEEARPVREALAVLDARAGSLPSALRAANADAGTALRQISRAVVMEHLEALRSERQQLLETVAAKIQPELTRLHQLHAALYGAGSWQYVSALGLDSMSTNGEEVHP